MARETFFDSVNDLIAYLYHKFPSKTPLSPIKLQKMLYFLFAYYGASIGNVSQEDIENTDMDQTYPEYLFPESFQAWKYGPVIRSVYQNNKNDDYDQIEEFDSSSLDEEVLEYLDDLFLQLEEINDFSLVQRSHMDKAWKDIYDSSSPYASREMDKVEIVKEYIANGS